MVSKVVWRRRCRKEFDKIEHKTSLRDHRDRENAAFAAKEQADKRKQEYEILLGQKRKKELEIHEIELAMKAIEEAASQVQKTFGQELNEKISEIFVI